MFFAQFLMFASVVSDERCQLFYICRVDTQPDEWVYQRMPYAPRSYGDAHKLAAIYQQAWDPHRKRFIYRAMMCD